MKLKLLHLFPDAMNLYGEYANVAVLERQLKALGHEVTVDTLPLWGEGSLEGYDFYYMGAGTEYFQKLALERLLPHRETLLRAAGEENRVLLFTGNASELPGASITDAKGKTYEALGLLDFTTVETEKRIVGDCLGSCTLFPEPVVGFMNKCSHTRGIETPLFSLDMGFGNEKQGGPEGFLSGRTLGTHLTGPVLVKNPSLLGHVLYLLTGEQVQLQEKYLEKAYSVTREALQNRMVKG